MPRLTPGARRSPVADSPTSTWLCAYDSTILDREGERAGWCHDGQGYALAYRVWLVDDTGMKREHTREVPCPFACPICFASLTWDGGCERCHGSRTSHDRPTWTFPGDRYELAPDRHYRRVAAGPRPVASEAEVFAVTAGIKRDLARWTRQNAEALPAWVTSDADDPEAVPF